MAKSLTTKKDKGKEKTAPKQRGRKPTPLTPYEGPNLDLKDEQIEMVLLDKLDLEDKTLQIRITDKPDDRLIESIKSHGIQIPLIVRHHPQKEDSYQIICGFRRASAAKIIELHKVPIIVRNLKTEDARILAYTENEYRKTLRDIDRANAIAKLKEANKTTGQVAALFRLSNRQVQRLQQLLDYPDILRKALNDNKITTTLAITLHQALNMYGEKFNLKEWLVDIASNNLSVNDLKKAIRKKFPQKRERGKLVHYRNKRNTIFFNISEIENAPVDKCNEAIKEIETIITRLRTKNKSRH